MNLKIRTALSVLLLTAAAEVYATAYPVPPANESLIGETKQTATADNDTVVTIAQRYNIGFNAIESANPQLDVTKGLISGSHLTVPTQHLLPNLPREGIVINLPEMRMYYYVAGTGQVLTYPIGIGKVGKTIPITKTAITRKVKDPIWVPPADIREFNLEQGIVLPRIMPAGPDNPLGQYAIYMRVPTYLIHSTIFPESVGKRASFGCIRMFESDIQTFFPSIQGGIPVTIINAPIKLGWQDNKLYVETHRPLEEHANEADATLPGMVNMVNEATKDQATLVDWQALAYLAKERDGMPHEVGMKLPTTD